VLYIYMLDIYSRNAINHVVVITPLITVTVYK